MNMNKREVIENEYHPLTIMAHDIKSPLTAIVDLLYVIEKGYVTDVEKSMELVSRARVKALELVRMVDDILDYTLLAHKDNVKRTRIDLREIITESISGLSGFANQKGITISPIEAFNCPCYILGNRVFLLRAFHNIIMNAIKYNSEGGNIFISIIPLMQERKIKIIIKDNGIGIDEDELKRVFNIFHRGRRARKNIDGSLGLGLSLVRQIITGHDGTIDIQSKAEHGTTVTLVLPLIGGENE